MVVAYLDQNVNSLRLKDRIKEHPAFHSLEFMRWPLEAKPRIIQNYGLPAGHITWDDIKYLTWEQLDFCNWEDFECTEMYPQILSIMGEGNRKDAIHFDIAIKNKCLFFFTSDKDFLLRKNELKKLANIPIYDPENEADIENFLTELNKFIVSSPLTT